MYIELLTNIINWIFQKYPNEDLTFEAMKRIISENPDAKREREAERQNQLYETFRTTSFNELVTKNIIDVIFYVISKNVPCFKVKLS